MTFKDAMANDVGTVFLNTDEFATVVVFEGSDVKVQLLDNYDTEGEAFYTSVWGKASDFAGISKNSMVTVAGVSYGVVDFKVDEFGDGMSVYLNEVIT